MGDTVCYLPLLDDEGRMPERRVVLRRTSDPAPAGAVTRTRVLVERGWPRGIRKQELQVALWARDLAPSPGLRRWFGHRPERWAEFRLRYREELREAGRARLLDQLAGLARQGPLTLLFSAPDRAHNQAVLIREGIEDRLADAEA